MNENLLYILVVNYYSGDLITRLIESVDDEAVVIVIVNNSPEDQSLVKLVNERVTIIESPNNLGFGKACNLGLTWIYQKQPTALVWLINPDAYFVSGMIAKARQFLSEHTTISILGTEVYEPSGELWFGWGEFNQADGTIVVVKESLNYQEEPYVIAQWVTGCSLLINLKNFRECPQFDPDYFLYYEDFDFCQRYRQSGYLVAVTNQIKVIHQPSSITLRYGYLRLTHNVYSYLLSLEKHTTKSVLWLRFTRMVITAILVFPFNPKFTLGKLKGILMYCQQMLTPRQSPPPPQAEDVPSR